MLQQLRITDRRSTCFTAVAILVGTIRRFQLLREKHPRCTIYSLSALFALALNLLSALCKKLFIIADHCKGTQQQSRCQSDQYILANARWTQTNSLKVIQTNGREGGTFVMRLREIREKSTLEKRGLHRIQRKYYLLQDGTF